MQCPVCKNHDYQAKAVRSASTENLYECSDCGTVWAHNHSLMAMVKDPVGLFLFGGAIRFRRGPQRLQRRRLNNP